MLGGPPVIYEASFRFRGSKGMTAAERSNLGHPSVV